MHRRRHRRTIGLAWIAAIALGVHAAAWAQTCYRPDTLDGGPGTCCQPAQADLPDFPAVSTTLKYLCFDDCNALVNANACVALGAATPARLNGSAVCGIYLIRFTVKTCNGANPIVLWSGLMRAQYSRTWGESFGSGLQVWRFLLNGDLVPSSFLISRDGHNACAVAPCAAANQNRIHVTGYVDYALDCFQGRMDVAFALKHDCDRFEHFGTARPGTFHATRAYAWVAPAGFTPITTPMGENGGSRARSSVRRNRWEALPAICGFRQSGTASFQAGTPVCPCSDGSGSPPGQYIENAFQGSASCGAGFATLDRGLTFMRVGAWTSGTVFPGVQNLLFVNGDVSLADGCIPSNTFQHVEGVETIGGFPKFALDAAHTPLGPVFDDFGSTNRSPANGNAVIGAPYVSWYVFNLGI
jgi:hypothetical protein